MSCPSRLHLPPGQLRHFTRLGELQVKVSDGCLDKNADCDLRNMPVGLHTHAPVYLHMHMDGKSQGSSSQKFSGRLFCVPPRYTGKLRGCRWGPELGSIMARYCWLWLDCTHCLLMVFRGCMRQGCRPELPKLGPCPPVPWESEESGDCIAQAGTLHLYRGFCSETQIWEVKISPKVCLPISCL